MQMTLPSTFVYEIIASNASDAKNKEARWYRIMRDTI
jgi:hypothetical protein